LSTLIYIFADLYFMAGYSNARAMRALTKASLQSILKSPSAIVFGIAFPLVFILVFGLLGNSKSFSISVASAPGSDTSNMLYTVLRQVPVLRWINYADTQTLNNAIKEGDITATIAIKQQPQGSKPEYKIFLNGSSAHIDKMQQLRSILNSVLQNMDPEIRKRTEEVAMIEANVTEIREFKIIDFMLPGQLGFSLLAGSVFGTAFVFFNMRQTLVLKRFFATPVRRDIIVMSEGVARMIFQLVTSIIIISIGHYVFDYTLVNGFVTFVELLVMSVFGIAVFMGFGFIVSSVAKSESTIPPFANLITMPQFLLAGTFFPIDNFPKWLQPICRALPLSFLNDAMRKIAFDGSGLWDVKLDIICLLIWGVIVYFIAGRVFRWE
jgi:ABC-2 type transport system permease protein